MYRYLALAWDRRDPDREAAAARLIAALQARAAEWTWLNAAPRERDGGLCSFDSRSPCARDRMGLALFHSGARDGVSDTTLLPEEGGAVFGTLFRSGSSGPRATLNRGDHREILASGGTVLLERCWGRYVAMLRTARGGVLVLRDPTGALPCLLAALHGVWVLFSNVEDVRSLGLELSVNWHYIAALIADFSLQASETGLEQVTEVQPGESIELCGSALERVQRWEPLRIARRDPLERPADAAAVLREAVLQCVHAWASCYPRILHRLSGGLDSSIVLAALGEAPSSPRVTCLTYWGGGPQEDERAFARLAAARAACALIERPYRPELTRLERALKVARTARPYFYLYSIEHGRLEARLAASLGATALFSGAGGDGLFYRDGAALAAADALWLNGPGRRLFRVALDAAIIERTSVWSVLGTALRARVHRAAGSPDAARRMRFAHTWLRDAHCEPPGKVRQVRSIGSPLPYYDPLGEPDDPESVQPLLSQPVMEVCLRIPIPTLVSGGWDRAVARHAFLNEIPRQIARRRAKGASTASAQRVFESNRPFLRDLLLGGLLVREGLLDPRALERTLARDGSLRDSGFVPLLLQRLATEVWLRRWTERPAARPDRDYLP